jgi:cellulose synthase/poly-beta-1,6-N-acetylglucosamine synthase-like glycosyltransferase
MFAAVLNYLAWYIFVFISVVWILVMLQNRNGVKSREPLKKLPSVTVLIPAFNEEETIGKTVKSVLDINYPKNLLEIIAIDDCSTDKTGELLDGMDKWGIRVLHNKINKGKAYSLNRGLKIATGKLIACIDADSIAEPNILKKMIPYFSDKKVAAVAPALKVWKTKSLLEKIQHAEYLLNIFLRKMMAFMDSIHVTPGVFSLYRKDVLNELEGFEEGNLTEDMEIALKIHNAGYKIENDLDALSYTVCPDKWRNLFRQRIRWYRGGIHNSIKYRHMFFNPKYGNLGVFFLPANFIAIGAIIILFLNMVLNNMVTAVSYLWRMTLIDFDVSPMLFGLDWDLLVSAVFSTPLLFGLMGFALGAYVLYISFQMTHQNVRSNKPGYFIYLLIFPLFLMSFWVLAFICELLRIKNKW